MTMPSTTRMPTHGPTEGILTRFQRSTWARISGRAALLVLGLLVLAWIGHAKAAATLGSAPAADAAAPDAGASPPSPSSPSPSHVAVPSALVPSPPPAAPAAAPASLPAAAPPGSHARATSEEPVYLNHAGAEDLRRLPGVGAKRAEAIVALRGRLGRFQRVEDLLRVKGIGRATLRKWRPLVRLDAPPVPAALVAADADAGAETR